MWWLWLQEAGPTVSPGETWPFLAAIGALTSVIAMLWRKIDKTETERRLESIEATRSHLASAEADRAQAEVMMKLYPLLEQMLRREVEIERQLRRELESDR